MFHNPSENGLISNIDLQVPKVIALSCIGAGIVTSLTLIINKVKRHAGGQ